MKATSSEDDDDCDYRIFDPVDPAEWRLWQKFRKARRVISVLSAPCCCLPKPSASAAVTADGGQGAGTTQMVESRIDVRDAAPPGVAKLSHQPLKQNPIFIVSRQSFGFVHVLLLQEVVTGRIHALHGHAKTVRNGARLVVLQSTGRSVDTTKSSPAELLILHRFFPPPKPADCTSPGSS